MRGVKAFAAIGNHQARRSHIGRQILPAHGNGILDADGVVEIDHGIDGGQDAIAQHPLAQCLGRAGRAGRLGAKPLEYLIPGGQMFKGPGGLVGAKGRTCPGQGPLPHQSVNHGGGFHHDAEGTKARRQPGYLGVDTGDHREHSALLVKVHQDGGAERARAFPSFPPPTNG
ncbi:hypothetical protein KAM472_02200 [Aeromonas caviae]|nr:hypothetical protein KAM465_08290 [Aeromonas caviae]GKR22107.1 hypothetical protein KAM468_08470 [Aeromonas caviae]GKR26406.1 hypothetical protein KAM469_08650 [Aeromonas caviae]GKR30382.1 hypothetical protein KAM470_04550 [Aeromonas caviae]GKR38524.1 hypothetical protein KAM472_02200 [Aeromonas caviae]